MGRLEAGSWKLGARSGGQKSGCFACLTGRQASPAAAGRLRTAILFLVALLFCGAGARAQTVPHVTGTFKTPGNLTPSAAGLRTIATIGATPVYGSVDFQPYDSSGNKPTRILCGGITYIPQTVRAWIKGDGTLVDNATAAAGVDLVPTEGCTPAGLVIRAKTTLAPTSDGRVQSVTWTEDKGMPQQASVDWGSLAAAGITAPTYAGYSTIENDGAAVASRSILNFIGGGCSDNPLTLSTDCPTGGGGGGATLKTNGVNNGSQAVLNFTDSTKVNWTAGAGGVEQAGIVAGSIQDADLAGSIAPAKISGVAETQTNKNAANGYAGLNASGLLALARGGTAADLSATGGAGQYLKQATLGGAVSVGTIPEGDVTNLVSDLAGKASTSHTHAAADIVSGVLTLARGGLGALPGAADQLFLSTAANTAGWSAVGDCSNATTSKLLYSSTTHGFSCGTDQTGAGGSGIVTLDTLTATTQTFSKTNDTNVTLTLTPSGSDHNFALGWQGTLGLARGGTNYASNTGAAGKVLIGDGSGHFVEGDPLVQGVTAHDAVGTSTNPVAAGGYASAAAPTDVSADGDIVRDWNLRNGAKVTQLSHSGTLYQGATETTLSALNAKIPASPATDRTTAAAPFAVELSDGAAFYTGAKDSTLSTLSGKFGTDITADFDTGAGTQNMILRGIALPASGGAVAGGTATNPLRIDPTGTTTQPVSIAASVTVQQSTGANLHMVCDSGCSGSGGTSSAFGAAFPSAGTAIGAKNGANMVNLAADASNNLMVNCAVGCAGGSTTPADAFANPTTAGLSFSFLAGYNGTTWDRLRVDGSKNLLVALNAAIPAGSNLIGGVNLSQIGGASFAQGQRTMANSVSMVPASDYTPTATVFDNSGAAITTAVTVHSSNTYLYSWFIGNPNASDCYLQMFNTTTPTLGTTAPILSLRIPASQSANIPPGSLATQFSTALSVASTTTATGSTTCTSGMVVNLWYQ